jgi:hypothetical protein
LNVGRLEEAAWIMAAFADSLQGLVSVGHVNDPFRAVSRDMGIAPRNFTLSDDSSDVPIRVVEPSGEVYTGPRGKLVVIKKRD